MAAQWSALHEPDFLQMVIFCGARLEAGNAPGGGEQIAGKDGAEKQMNVLLKER